MNYKICVAGKNHIAINAINILLSLKIEKESIMACYNDTDNGVNTWQPSFKSYCERKKIKAIKLQELYNLKDLYFFSLEFDKIIDIHKFKTDRIFNIHFSLLPKYKGMYTSIFPILNLDEETGVTLHEIDNGIDTGDIIDQIKFDIGDMTSLDVYNTYIEKGTELFERNISKLLAGNYLKTQQSHKNSTYNSKTSIKFGETQIPLKQTAFEIVQWVKAFSFRPYQMAKYKSYSISHVRREIVKSENKAGYEIEDHEFYIKIATIDYDVRLYKDKIAEIIHATSINDVNYIRQILGWGYNINDWGENGWTPLMVAAYHGCYETVNLLVENGADPNAINFNGTTILMYAMTNAALTNDFRTFNYCLSLNSNLEHRDCRDKSIFDYAQNYQNKKIIDALNVKVKNDSIS